MLTCSALRSAFSAAAGSRNYILTTAFSQAPVLLPCRDSHFQVFLIHIMDYAFGVDDGTSKLHHRMRFGPELRILPQWVSDCCPNRRDARYRLVSTVTHHGRHAAGTKSGCGRGGACAVVYMLTAWRGDCDIPWAAGGRCDGGWLHKRTGRGPTGVSTPGGVLPPGIPWVAAGGGGACSRCEGGDIICCHRTWFLMARCRPHTAAVHCLRKHTGRAVLAVNPMFGGCRWEGHRAHAVANANTQSNWSHSLSPPCFKVVTHAVDTILAMLQVVTTPRMCVSPTAPGY